MLSNGNTNRPLKVIGRVSSSSGFLASAGKLTSIQCLAGPNAVLDPMQLMSMQEDAYARKISTEVMRRSLHNSITTPCRRRYNRSRKPSSGMTGAGRGHAPRYFQSLPVTPARPSPSSSPTRNLDGSREVLPFVDLQVEEDSWRGLASLFKPKPRYIGACYGSKTALCGENDENLDSTNVVDLQRVDGHGNAP